jgi:D-beta-D-heptose 7-phosphate kinase/D-beta-D-heptose 1-phosphate adenosyltransferase
MKIAVIGDVIIDRYIYGSATRLSPEAPVPVIQQNNIVIKQGGAGNLFDNLQAIGVDVDLIDFGQKNSIKTRVFCDRHYVTRIDEDFYADGTVVLESVINKDFSKYDYVILSDYGKGVLDESIKIISHISKFGCKVIVDPKKCHNEYSGAWLVKPNESEYKKYEFNDWKDNIITTRSNGNVLSYFDGIEITTRVDPVEVSDVTGAGDCFLAAFVYGLTKKYNYKKCLEIAARAASISVTYPGTYVLKPEDVEQKIIFTNGCFDILHRGHIEYLQQSKKLGDKLIVGINSDESVRRLKGSTRPINNQEDRVAAISALKCVDEVHIFSEDTPYELIKKLSPDIITKGGDYTPNQVIGNDLAEVIILSYVQNYSTTDIVRKLNDET